MILILDLDDTIYNTTTIDAAVIKGGLSTVLPNENVEEVYQDFKALSTAQMLDKYKLNQEAVLLFYTTLVSLKDQLTITPFEDYSHIEAMPYTKYLVTTGYAEWQITKINHLGITSHFDTIMIDDILTRGKNKKDYFMDIMKLTGEPPSRHVVIGDNPHNELKYGHELGMKVIQRNSGRKSRYLAAHQWVDSFEEIRF
jgi:putative hydrolase of the HAD superfamily